MTKAVLVALATVLLFAAGFAVAYAAKPPSPPGQDPCSHGNSDKPCRDDPQPGHGKDCEHHGEKGGVDEDHCAGETTETTTDTTTETTTGTSTSTTTETTTTTGTTTSTPVGTTETTGTTTETATSLPPTETVTETTLPPEVPGTVVVSKPKPKQPNINQPKTPGVPTTRVFHGKQHPVVMGAG